MINDFPQAIHGRGRCASKERLQIERLSNNFIDVWCSTIAETEQQIREEVADASIDWNRVLLLILRAFECQAGTLHFRDAAANLLRLVAVEGIPRHMHKLIRIVPMGKGMAGIAAQRAGTVQVCNLQVDKSGVAREGAKTSGMEGSLAVPIIVDGGVSGVLGVAKTTHYDWSKQEIAAICQLLEIIGKVIPV
jgi:signal transduction protein with GAF and PtsI domain